MYKGPKINSEDIFWGYDTGYNDSGVSLSNGHKTKGPVHTNLLENIANSTSDFNNTGRSARYGEKICYIPTLGDVNVRYCDYFNNHGNADGSGNTAGSTCCPNLFNYHGNNPYIPIEASTSYTYSIIYKHSDNYTHPNFMYRYERNSSGTTLTEGGVYSTSSDRRTHLGDGWYHAWGSFTTQSTAAYMLAYSFLYNYGRTYHRYYVAGISLVKNQTSSTHFIVPPQHMVIPVAHTAGVSTTESLENLKKAGATINVNNTSNTEKGALTFDGTDDCIDINNTLNSIGSLATFEAVFKSIETNDIFRVILGWGNGSSNYSSIGIGNLTGGYNNESLHLILDGGTVQVHVREGHTAFKDNNYHHVVVTAGQNNYSIWVDGVEKNLTFQAGSQSTNFDQIVGYNSNIVAHVGKRPHYNNYFKGEIPVVKVHDKILSDQEIVQNYKAYKNRFNI